MSNPDDARTADRLSIAYVMAITSEVLRRFSVDMMDLMLIATVVNLNLMAAGRGVPDATRPSDSVQERMGVSRNAVSRALSVPLETVRRRIAGLIDKKILVEGAEGIVFAPDNPLGLGNNADLSALNLDLLRQLFRGLNAAGIDLG